MEDNHKINISMENFIQWCKSANEGHKRLWIILSSVWVLGFMAPNLFQYYKDIRYCSAAEENIVGIIVDGVGYETYKRCNVTRSQRNYVNLKGEDAISDSYKMSAKYDYIPILWALIMPLGLPLIMYLVAWVRSGYLHDD